MPRRSRAVAGGCGHDLFVCQAMVPVARSGQICRQGSRPVARTTAPPETVWHHMPCYLIAGHFMSVCSVGTEPWSGF